MAPKDLVKVLSKSGLIKPSETAVRNMLDKHSRAMNTGGRGDNIMDLLLRADEPDAATKVFVASMDGATVLMRDGKAQAGAAQASKQDEPSPSDYRVAMVGALGCYDIEEVVDEKSRKRSLQPVRLSRDYFAQMPESGCATFKSDFEFHCMETTDKLPAGTRKLMLMDGAKWQWDYVAGDEQFDDYEKLLDYWHACGHLATAAENLFGSDTEARRRWRKKWKSKLKNDAKAVPKLLRAMMWQLNKRPLGSKASEQVRKEMAYFKNNAALMNYARFKRNGWPIGSGPVEAACKTIVKQRLCCSGMRWTNQGGQAVLDIRSLIQAGRWESFWEHAQKTA